MNPEYKAAWLKALRSGQYVQTCSTLKVTYACGVAKHCCLGVLLEIHAAKQEGEFQRSIDAGAGCYHNKYQVFGPHTGTHTGNPRFLGFDTLPLVVRDRLGISDDEHGKLISMNDNGETFAAIADWIEANL